MRRAWQHEATSTTITLTCAPITWGRVPRRLGVFLEPTCPFSGRAFGKFDELLARVGA